MKPEERFQTESETEESLNEKEESKRYEETNEEKNSYEFSKAVLSLDEKSKQILFDSLYSAISNTNQRDSVLHLVFTKAKKILRENGTLEGSPETDTEFSNLVSNLSSQVRQVLYDSVCSAIENQNERDTILHILFRKAEKLLAESGK
ncbi:hypothetical protein EHQ76_06955 [Leptospira barantonii]|uniref:Uncharacterized protein n=1 Tax=Leptospira barantonii TaxID=2023184 RepID=A0A5F2BKA5_9LEPT|nr:hypothetical protein EHQ76_06955 [Leptospira barantonii]